MKRLHSILIQSLQFLVIILAVGTAFLTYDQVQKGMDELVSTLKSQVIHSLEDSLGYKINYDEISPSLLSSIEIRNFHLIHPDTGETFLSIRNLKLYYNPVRAFFKKSSQALISNVYLTGVNITVDEQRDRALLTRMQNGSDKSGNQVGWELGRFFSGRIRIRSLSVNYSSAARSFIFHGNTMTVKQQKDYLRVKLGGDFSLADHSNSGTLQYLSLTLDITGSVYNDLKGFNINGDFNQVRSNLFDMESQRFNIRYSGEEFKIAKIRDRQPYDLSLTINSEQILMDFSAEKFSFDKILAIKGRVASLNPWLNTVLTGGAHLEFNRKNLQYRYSYDGSAYINNSVVPFPVQAVLDFNGDSRMIHAENLNASTTYGSVVFRGDWAFREGYPEGDLLFSNIPVSKGVRAEGRLILSQVDEYFYIHSESLALNTGWTPGQIRVLVSKDTNHYVFSFRGDLNPRMKNADQIFANGKFTVGDTFQLESDYRIHSLDSRTALSFFPSLNESLNENLLKNLTLSSQGSFSLDGKDYALTLGQLEIHSGDGQKKLECRGFFSPRELEIYALEASWGKNYLLGTVNGYISGGTTELRTNWNINNNIYLINGAYSDGKLSLLGNYGLKGLFLRSPDSSFLATLETGKLPVRWDGQDLSASLNIRGRYLSQDWEVYLRDTSLSWDNTEMLAKPEVKITAYLAPGALNIFSLQYSDDFSTLRGSGTLFYNLDQKILNGSLNLKESENKTFPETYSVYCVYNDGNISSTLVLKNALTDRFLSLDMKGPVDAEVAMEGSLRSPVVEGEIRADNLEVRKNVLGFSGKFRLDPEKLDVYDLNFRRNSVTFSRGLGFLNFQDGNVMLTARYANRDPQAEEGSGGVRIESGFSVMAETGESVEIGNLKELLKRNFIGRLRIHPIKWNDLTTFPSQVFDITREGPHVFGQLYNDESQFFSYNSETRAFKASLGEPFPLSFETAGIVDPENLDLEIRNLKVNLNLINYYMPKDKALESRYVVFRENSCFRGNLKVKGTSRNPLVQGVLNSENLMVLTPYTVNEIGETQMTLTFSGDRVETNRFEIPIGEGGLTGQAYADINGWALNDYEVAVTASGSPGTPFSYNAYGIQGKGAFTGDVRLFGTSKQGGLEGRIVLNELVGSMGSRTKYSKKKKSSGGYPFQLDLEFITGRSVLFILPNPQLEIVRATAEQGEQLNLQLDTRNNTLSMTGEISIRNGEINYFDRSFRMTEGSLTFNENEDSFNPFLNLEAEIDTTDIDGEDVTVYLTYRNPILDEFTPVMRSDPPMSDEQITALFGQSMIPYDTDEVDLSTLVMATGGMMSEYGFVEPFETALKDSLKLDSVTIKTEILENALLDQLEGYQNYSGTESSYNLGRYLDNTSIYLGQFLGDYLFFSAGLLVDYNELDGIRSYTGGISLVPDLTLEMQTPFFLVSWNYNQDNAPDFNTDFVPKNAISLEWRYSY